MTFVYLICFLLVTVGILSVTNTPSTPEGGAGAEAPAAP